MSSPNNFQLLRGIKTIDLSKAKGPKDATVVVVPLPKGTVGIVFGQRTADYDQRYVTYLLDADGLTDEQAVWDAPDKSSRFNITRCSPPNLTIPDTNVLSIGPLPEDRNIAVHLSHKASGQADYEESIPQHDSKDFEIGGINAISFTMINAEDGGDKDYHDTVVGIAVVSTTK